MTEPIETQVLIIGTGFSGLGMAIHLQEAGLWDFLLLEKADEVGGTWRENTYPGAECDIPSALYSYSFEHNAGWEYKWSEQPQIFEYLKRTARKYDLYPRIRFGREVQSAEFDEREKGWRVTTADGQRWRCRFLISAVGQLHRPFIPDIPGQDRFEGVQFHSARWNHAVALRGKRVAVVGNAASALQFIPQIAPKVERLTVFQRSANWVMPKFDRPYRRWEQKLADAIPLVAKLYRLRIWLRNELIVFPVMRGNRPLRAWLAWLHRRYLKRYVSDPELRARLTPDYPVGARRILFSDDYYDGLIRDNVELVCGRIESFTETGIVRSDGQRQDVDVVIYGTGFRSNPFLAPMEIVGAGGRRLRDAWREGAHAYLGMATSGFPNFFMLYGPNTNLGHNSIVIMAESQARYITRCIADLQTRGRQLIDVRPEAENAFDSEQQARLQRMVWNETDHSWYKDGDRITNNWAGSTLEYIRRTRRIDWRDFLVS